jgi:hypothetical protein
MSEREWLEAPNTLRCWDEGPHREWTTDRKLRLWACACCRRISHLLPDKRSRDAIEVAERFADGRATEVEGAAAFEAASAATDAFDSHGGMERVHNWAAEAALWTLGAELAFDPERVPCLAAIAVREYARLTGPPEERDRVTDNREGGPFAVAAEEAADLEYANLLREVFGTVPPGESATRVAHDGRAGTGAGHLRGVGLRSDADIGRRPSRRRVRQRGHPLALPRHEPIARPRVLGRGSDSRQEIMEAPR